MPRGLRVMTFGNWGSSNCTRPASSSQLIHRRMNAWICTGPLAYTCAGIAAKPPRVRRRVRPCAVYAAFRAACALGCRRMMTSIRQHVPRWPSVLTAARARLRWDSGMRCWPVGSVQRPSVTARLVLGAVALPQRQRSMWNVVGAGPLMR